MTNDERATLLRAAANLITQVRDSLNNESAVCDCCGMVKFAHWNDKQMRDELNGSVNRLRKVEDRLFRTEGQLKRHEG